MNGEENTEWGQKHRDCRRGEGCLCPRQRMPMLETPGVKEMDMIQKHHPRERKNYGWETLGQTLGTGHGFGEHDEIC